MSLPASYRGIREALQTGTLSCTTIVNYYLGNIRKKSQLNAFLSIYESEAIECAKQVDQKIQQGQAGKLAGLVISLKDVFAHKHHPLQASSKILEGYTAPYNATIVQRLLDEDAIIIGRTNCDEFGMGSSNENSSFGSVRNALDQTKVPGGSSGGAAVAVQADMCCISIGSDTGGSVRQPAAFCGIIGFKPTYSRISRYGLAAYASSFDCVGILGKNIEDIALVLEVLAGKDEFDSTVSTKTVPSYSTLLQSDKKYRIGFIRNTLSSPGLQEEIKKSVQSQLEKFKVSGHEVEEIEFPLLDYCLPTYYLLATAEASSNLSRYDGVRFGYRSPNTVDLNSMYKKSRSEGFGTEVKRRILLGTFALSASYYDAYYTKAQQVRRIIRKQTTKILSEYDFIIMPTTPTTAFQLGKHIKNPLEMYLGDLYSVYANVAGVPAISVTCGIDDNGLPIGLQIIANDFEEPKLFQFANSIFLN